MYLHYAYTLYRRAQWSLRNQINYTDSLKS